MKISRRRTAPDRRLGVRPLGWLVVVALGTVVLMTASSASAGKSQDIANLTWGVTEPVLSLDPAFAYDGGATDNVAYAECDTLLRFDDKMNLQPDIATSWKQTSPLSLVYQIGKGIKFWDGHTLTPADVAYSLNRILNPKLASPLESLTATVKQAVVSGPNQVTIKLKTPDPRDVFLAALPTGLIVEKAAVLKYGSAFGTTPQTIECSGPFRPTQFTKGQSVTLQRVSNYWNTKRIPHVQQATFTTVPDPATLVAGLRSGQIDGTFYLNGRNAQILASDPSLTVTVLPGNQIDYISPNLLKGPLRDLRVRKALDIALDRTGLAFAVSGKYAETLKGPVPLGLSSWQTQYFNKAYNSLWTPLHPQISQAKKLIASAHAKGEVVTIGIMDSPTADTVGPALESAGAAIGLKIEVKKLPVAAYQAENFSGKEPRTYDGLVNFWASDYPDLSGNLITPFGSKFSNVEGFFNKQYEAMERKWATLQAQSMASAKMLSAMEKFLVDDVVKIPLYTEPLINIHKKSITGYSETKVFFYQDFLQDIHST